MAEEYQRKVNTITNHGTISLALALSKEVGILSSLVNADKPLTLVDIASQNQLKKRYVQELLGSLVSAELIQLSSNEAGKNTYFLTNAQKEGLNTGLTSPLISLIGTMAEIYERVKACTALTGPYGFLYEEKAQDTIEEFSNALRKTRMAAIFESDPDLQQRLESGIDVIEFGSGTGSSSASLARQFPNSRFTVTELTSELVSKLRSRWTDIPNISFDVVDICNTEVSPVKKYDWAFAFNVIHDLPQPQDGLNGSRRVMKQPGGIFTFIEACASENGTHEEGIGDTHVADIYARSTFMCIREGLQDEKSVVLGACGGRTVIQEMARKAGFKALYKALDPVNTLFICRV